MTSVILFSDENNDNLGDFFKECSDNVIKHFEKISDKKPLVIKGSENNLDVGAFISVKASTINQAPFVFISFTHGNSSEVFHGNKKVISSAEIRNDNYLKNSFYHCFACSVGESLGAELVEAGTLGFLGYKKDVYIQNFFGARSYFVSCATIGINYFLKGSSAKEAKNITIKEYNDSIDEFYKKDFPTAALLMDNRDALVLHGDPKLRIVDI